MSISKSSKNIYFWVFFIALIILATTVLAILKKNFDNYHFADTAQYYAMLENSHKGLDLYNPFIASILDFTFIKKIVTLSAAELCSLDLEAGPYTIESFNHLKFHFYLILYPISVFLNFFEAPQVTQWINIFAFISFIGITYLIMKKQGAPALLCLFGILSITIHPAWSWSIAGQAYVDRLYLPFGILIFYLIENQKRCISPLYAIALLSSLIVEKVFIINAIFISTYALLYFNNKKIFISRISYATFSLIIFICLIKYFTDNIYYSSTIPHSFNDLISLINFPNFINASLSFLTINLILLIPSLFTKPKLFIIGLIMLLPNLLGNIGGAEKIGFTTHYHVLYFPFIVYIYINSICNIYSSLKRTFKKLFLILYILAAIIFYTCIAFTNESRINLNISNYTNSYISYFIRLSKGNIDNNKIQKIVDSEITTDKKISATEAAMPYLYKQKYVSMFPLNIDSSDFLLIGYTKKDSDYYFYGFSGYLGENNNQLINNCLDSRIKSLNFDTKNPIILGSNLAILKRLDSNKPH